MFRVGAELYFLPASIALKVMPTPSFACVPGGPPELCGVALVDGVMIPVVDVSCAGSAGGKGRGRAPARGAEPMLVCSVLGEGVGLVGVEVLATGFFDVAETGEVQLAGEPARSFDVTGLIARVREGRWAV
jgi:chemotaxis signal transduction protein